MTARETVLDFHRKGATPAQINRDAGVPLPEIYRILFAAGEKPNKTLTKDRAVRDEEIVADYVEGKLSLMAIAVKHSVAIITVYHAVEKAGVPKRGGGRRKEGGPLAVSDKVKRAVDLYTQGMGLAQIRAETDVSLPTLYEALYRMKFPLRRPKEAKSEQVPPDSEV